ncbi:Ribosomal protein S4 [Methanonatronarchaeum thermophilum]|uniref:Small ribosomal subunit protein uS4 n=1 Tax=Methanonatronarchaeum thermophilum TaxID=1927129 RepID=A0A1Y3GBM2_9EURY|nr:30S ribosomal protein S4 [Methanonatronarchaeum thermophilum]OUJ18819.1 Ribosomal protein S4 [Methanonatronarchaeum thermophilum]
MGSPKKNKKTYETPPHPWQQLRMEDESRLIQEYGLKNKKEIWKAESNLRNYRRKARELLAEVGRATETSKGVKKEKQEFLDKLKRYGLVSQDGTLDDVLGLKVRDILDRRLQSIVNKKGYARTPKQARQFIVHGHIALNGQRVTIPSYLVKTTEENQISYSHTSPMKNEAHPERIEKVEEEL